MSLPIKPKRVIIVGGMFAGKTSELLNLYTGYKKRGTEVLMLNPGLNTRDVSGEIKSHTGLSESVELFDSEESFSEIIERKKPQIVFIDEVQFVDNIEVLCDKLFKLGISVYMSGLTLDWRGEPFPNTQKILPSCEIRQKFAICRDCGSEQATHSALVNKERIPTNTNDYTKPIIGGAESFKPLCLGCFLEQRPTKQE